MTVVRWPFPSRSLPRIMRGSDWQGGPFLWLPSFGRQKKVTNRKLHSVGKGSNMNDIKDEALAILPKIGLLVKTPTRA